MAEDTKRGKLADRIGQFVALPALFVNDTRVSVDAFRLFAVLRSYTSMSNATDKAFPGYETLRIRCAFGSYRNVARAIKELESLGWIERRKRFGNSAQYFLNPRPTVLPPLVEMEGAHSPTTVGSTVLPPLVASVLPTVVEELEVENKKKSNPEVERRGTRKTRTVSGFGAVYTSHDDPRVAAFLEILARKQITSTDAEIIQKRVATDTVDVWRDVLVLWAANPKWRLDLADMFDRYERTVNAKRFTSKTDAPNYQNGAYKNAMPAGDKLAEALRMISAKEGSHA